MSSFNDFEPPDFHLDVGGLLPGFSMPSLEAVLGSMNCVALIGACACVLRWWLESGWIAYASSAVALLAFLWAFLLYLFGPLEPYDIGYAVIAQWQNSQS